MASAHMRHNAHMKDATKDGRPRAGPKVRPVRPRDAASLVLYRHGPVGLEALMGRRASRSRFMPDVYVFPGGTVDTVDARAQPATPLSEEIPPLLAIGARLARGRGLAMAAVRETFEETGLILGRPGNPGASGHASWRAMGESGFAPDLAMLRYVGRAITPTVMPIRFHARFFSAPADGVEGELASTDELRDLRWVPVGDPGTLPMAGVTRFILRHAGGQIADPDAARGGCVFTYTERGRRVRYS